MRLNELARLGIRDRMDDAFNGIYREYVEGAGYDRHEVARQMKYSFDAFKFAGYNLDDEPKRVMPAVQVAMNEDWAEWGRFCCWKNDHEGMSYAAYCEAYPINKPAQNPKSELVSLPLPG